MVAPIRPREDFDGRSLRGLVKRPRDALSFGAWPGALRSISSSGLEPLKRCTQFRKVWRSMLPILAASTRV